MKAIFSRLANTALLLVSLPLHAITIGLNPATQTVTSGSSIDVALVVSGLGTAAAPSIGTFDLDLGFDSSILSFSGAVFGDPGLGDQLDLLGLGTISSVTPGTGTVNVFELSLDDASTLDALQADAFTLATLSFSVISTGTSPLGITLNALGDANGDPLTADLLGGSVIANANTGSIPEPEPWLLLGVGALIMNRFVHRARAQNLE